MNRIISSLDAIVGPLPDEVTKAVTESPETFDSLGIPLIISALALVAVAVIGIILFSRKTKTE